MYWGSLDAGGHLLELGEDRARRLVLAAPDDQRGAAQAEVHARVRPGPALRSRQAGLRQLPLADVELELRTLARRATSSRPAGARRPPGARRRRPPAPRSCGRRCAACPSSCCRRPRGRAGGRAHARSGSPRAARSAPGSTSPIIARQKPSVLRAWPSVARMSEAMAASSARRAIRTPSLKRPSSIRPRARPASSRARPGGGVAGRPLDQLERALERGDALLRAVEVALRARDRLEDPGGAPRVGIRAELGERGLEQRELPAGMAERPGRLSGARRAASTWSAPATRRGVGHAVPQLERALEQRARLAVRVHALGRRGGAHGRGERRRLVAGGGVVVGDGGGQHRAGATRRSAPPAPRASARCSAARSPGQQVVLDDLAQQRVAEPVAVVVAGEQDVALDRLAQPVAQRAPVEPADLGQQRIVGPLGDRDEPQQLLRRARTAARRAASARRAACPAPRRGRRGRRRAAPRSTAGCRPSASTAAPAARPPAARRGCPRAGRSSSACVSGSSAIRRARGLRSSSASSGRSGWRRCISSGR